MSLNNSVTICGNLTRDPEMKYLPNGTALARFTVAINDSYKKNGEDVKRTHFVDCSCWKGLAEGVTRLRKGASVIVMGSIQQETWEDKTTHEKKSKLSLNATAVGESCFQKAGAAPAQSAPTAAAPSADGYKDDSDIPF